MALPRQPALDAAEGDAVGADELGPRQPGVGVGDGPLAEVGGVRVPMAPILPHRRNFREPL